MNLEGILYISGKQGLFKIVSTSKNKIIVENLYDKKRTAISSNQQANMLEEIGIYTYTDTVSLSTIFEKIAIKENANKSISHKSKDDEISSYFREILNEYDEERVYLSNIKKVIQWYNLLQEAEIIKLPEPKKKKKNKIKKTKNEI